MSGALAEADPAAAEADRLASLRDYKILDTEPDARFDAITYAAARILKCPTALVSLIDENRLWFKAATGGFQAGREIRRSGSFCPYSITEPQRLMVVNDARTDPRFASNPAVSGPGGICFYAGAPILDRAGRVLGTLCVIDTVPRSFPAAELETLRDLATAVSSTLELHRAMIELRESEEHYRATVELNPQVSWIADTDGRMLEFSSRVTALTGRRPEQLLDGGWIRLTHWDERAGIQKQWRQCLGSGETLDIENRLRVADGTYRWFRTYAAPRRDENANIVRWYGTFEDITDRRLSQAQIAHMAYHDHLTGLPNAAHFRERLEQQLHAGDESRPFALLSIDLDGFKLINDTLGHPAGDKLLKIVAWRLSGCVRLSDMVGRLGGDEFFVLQTLFGDLERPDRLPERILDALREPVELDGTVVSLDASIGITIAPRDGLHPDKLFQNADLALYRAKRAGRGTIRFFEPGMDESVRSRQTLRRDLEQALRRDEFDLVFQPIVDLSSGRACGFEALLRWDHPVRGRLSPCDFIDEAEQAGIIVPIGDWALGRACREAASWPGSISVAVNLSSTQFRRPDFLETIEAALIASGLTPERLELEITESVLLLDDETNLSTLHGLRAMGVRIVMDDFGTGYSSLSTLHRFPFDTLKIDGSFISELARLTKAQAIVRAILGMSGALRIATVAEGVETREQLDRLRAEGCDRAQGYLFSRPVGAGDIASLIGKSYFPAIETEATS